MEIRVRETGAVMFEDQWRRYIKEKTGLNFGQLDEATLNQHGADVVFEGPQASGGTVYQYSMRSGVEQIAGKWYTKYTLGPVFTDTAEATAAQQETTYKAMKDAEFAKSARDTRDRRLADCDWVVVKAVESGQSVSVEWATYRQALRDIPQQAGFPVSIQWPDKP